MKKFLLIILAMTASVVALFGQNPDMFFSVTQGDSFTYTIYSPDGEVEYKYSCTNKEVNGADLSDASVVYGYQFWKGDGKPLFADEGKMDMKISSKIKGIANVSFAHMLILGVSLGTSFLMPMFLSVESYGYWQLFSLYGSYRYGNRHVYCKMAISRLYRSNAFVRCFTLF